MIFLKELLAQPWLQTLATVLGWIIMMLWSVHQIKQTSKESIKAQKSLIVYDYRRYLSKNLLDLYKNVSNRIYQLKGKINHFNINFQLETNNPSEPIKCNAATLVSPIDAAYLKTCDAFYEFSVWAEVYGEEIDIPEELDNAQKQFEFNFLAGTKEKNGYPGKTWLELQTRLKKYESNDHPDTEEMWKSVNDTLESLNEIEAKLKKGISKLNRSLLTEKTQNDL